MQQELTQFRNGYIAYKKYANSIPILELDEEHLLGNKVKFENCLVSAKRLILSHLRLVVSIADDNRHYGIQLDDLVQEGSIGLMEAVHKYDPAQNVRLGRFAQIYIKSKIYDFIIANWKIVKSATTKARRKLFFNLRKLRAEMHQESESEPEPSAIAKRLNVPIADVHEMTCAMSIASESSFNSLDDDTPFHDPEDILHVVDDHPEALWADYEMHTVRKNVLMGCIKRLSARERDIIKSRSLTDVPVILDVLSKRHSISIERVRQIEKTAIGKITKFILDNNINSY